MQICAEIGSIFCANQQLRPLYELWYEGSDGFWKLPDFTFLNAADDPLIWEHLGILDDPRYRSSWERKLAWYVEQGFVPGESLFWTDEQNGLDVGSIDRVIAQVL